MSAMNGKILAFAALLVCLSSPPAAADPPLALVGVRIYPSPKEAPIPDGTILIQDGKIAGVGGKGEVRVPEGARVIEGAGLTVTAGFWNSHVHFMEPKWQNAAELPASRLAAQIREMLTRFGFTHALETGGDLRNTLALRRRIEAGEIPGPAIRTTGMPFVPPRGTPFYVAPMVLPEMAAPSEAAALVRQRIEEGADAVKLFTASPVVLGKPAVVMPAETARAAVSAAHELGRPVIAHPTSNSGIEVAVMSGVDILAHTAPDGDEPWSEALIRRMRTAGVALTPTLKLWTWELARNGAPPKAAEAFLELALQQTGAYSSAGGTILFGTDVGYMADYDPTDEYVLMSRAGMSFPQILASLTTAPAQRFEESGRTGRIARGMEADLVVLAGDPAADVRALANVRYTLRAGRILYEAGR